MTESICGPDEYFDGLDDSCVPCSVICRPDIDSQDFCRNNCPGYMIPDVPSKYTKRGGTTSARKPSLTSTSTATTKVLTSTALTPGSALAGLGEASPVNLLLSLLIITLTVVVIFGVVIGVVFVVRRRRTNNPTPRLTVADSQRRNVGGEDCKALISVAGNDHIAAHDGTSRDTATALRQLNAAQVRVARETLICSVSLQPHTDHASSLPDAMPPT